MVDGWWVEGDERCFLAAATGRMMEYVKKLEAIHDERYDLCGPLLFVRCYQQSVTNLMFPILCFKILDDV